MSRNRKRQCKKTIPVASKRSKTCITVKHQKHVVRRFEAYHTKFLSCQEIKTFLVKLQSSCPSNFQLKTIGYSAQGRPIYMAVISEGATAVKPKSGVMVVAGTNGSHWFSISSALYLIEQLVKGRNLLKVMDYFIVPCCNPDAYTNSLSGREEQTKVPDLSKNFPFSLGVYDLSDINKDRLLTAVGQWRNCYQFECPERVALIQTFLNYQVAVKMFISLEGGGTKITYPFGFSSNKTFDSDELKKVANAGKKGIRGRCFDVGTMYDLNGLCFGSLLDYLRISQGSVRFTFTIHVSEEQKDLDPCKILPYGEDVVNCVRFMARNVYMIYDKREINTCDGFFIFILSFRSLEIT